MREVTRQPIKFAGTGEKLDQFELFRSGATAGRILGMGDVVGLVEKAAEAVDEEEAARLERKLRTASFDFNDFLAQFKMMRKMGPLENILGMLPGMSNVQGLSIDEKQLKRTGSHRAFDDERRADAPGHSKCAAASAHRAWERCTVTEVNDLLRRLVRCAR